MFSSTAEYALRAVVYLATHREGLHSSEAIAEVTKVPAGYLSKVLKDLAEAGVVSSRRGPNGGFALARPAEDITVLEVVNAVDPIQRIRTCPLGIPSHGTSLCRLHRKLDDTIALMEQTLQSATIAEMCEPQRAGNKCVFPTIRAPRKPAGSQRR
jgi:Rrf2 family protein